jgi:hypothetical protein
MRPQLPGESFIQRAGKNAMLAMAEAFMMQGVLAIRQLVLPPSTYSPRGTAASQMINIIPERPK